MLQYWGNSYGFGYIIADADALAWANNVASGDGGVELEDAIKQAMDTYVQTLKTTGLGGAAGSIWSQAVQLLLHCGPRTLAGALRPLKGAVPTNNNYVSGNYNRKSGLGKASNTNAYLDSNVPLTALGATSHALFAYGSITETTNYKWLAGAWNGTDSTLVDMNAWLVFGSAEGRTFRSGSQTAYPTIASSAAVSCMIGSRISSTNNTLYADGSTATNTESTTFTAPTGGSSRNIFYSAINNVGAPFGYSSSVIQARAIFSTGLNATQAAALRSATASYVAAVTAAIP